MRAGLSALLAAASALALPGGPARAAEPVLRQIYVGGQARAYTLDRHDAADAVGLLPIIVFLPGLGTHVGERLPVRFDLPFAAVPNLGPALIVQAQGANRRWDSIPGGIDTWQRLSGLDGRFVDDIGFLRALIGDLVARDGGDPRRVYVAGVSSGGYMAARVACEMSDVVTAVADVIATMREAQVKPCEQGRPVPFLLMASTTDPTNPYGGSKGDEVNAVASAVDTAATFVKRDGCRKRTEEALPHLADVPSTVSLTRYSDCRDGGDVLFYRVDGSGHSVPSTAPPEPGGWEQHGARNRDIDAAAAIWAFFAAHR